MTGAGTSTAPAAFSTREQVIAVLVACAAGLLVLLISGGGDGDVPTASVPSEPQREAGPARDTQAPEPAPAKQPESPGAYSPSNPAYAYEVKLPAGKGWSEPDESYKRSYDLLRTTVRNEDGIVIAVDRTPNDIPAFTGNVDSSRTLPHPTFGEMTEYVFRFSTINPACLDDVCVDYLVEDGKGGGWGVLVGNAGLGRNRAIAERVADTLSLGE